MTARNDQRRPEDLRAIRFTSDFQRNPAGSVLVEFGGTRVICAVSITPEVPRWMREQGRSGGWLTAEYQMLPGSTPDRAARETGRGGPSGRSQEIQRLVGRSLRSVVDLSKLGPRTLYVDCDVLDADGGTRCASITGASVALEIALRRMLAAGELSDWPMRGQVAAVSVGVVKGEPVLDLCYVEDSAAEVDMNVVMTSAGRFVEVQGTAEGEPFGDEEMQRMLALAKGGLKEIFERQRLAVAAAVR
jgi:ribonuclease PH